MPVDGEIDPLGRRKNALDVFLEKKVAEGFTIETRTDTHAIITEAGQRFWSRVHRGGDFRRHVVQVDEDGAVTMSAAEPRRS
jgi:hypothetical protein